MVYKPIFKLKPNGRWLVKYENENYLFKASRSLGIRSEDLEKCDYVEVHVPKGDIYMASKREIKEYNHVLTWGGEKKHYYPIERWGKISRGGISG